MSAVSERESERGGEEEGGGGETEREGEREEGVGGLEREREREWSEIERQRKRERRESHCRRHFPGKTLHRNGSKKPLTGRKKGSFHWAATEPK